MELIWVNAKQLVKRLQCIKVKKELQNIDVSQMHNPPLPEPYIQEIIQLEVYDSENYSLTQYLHGLLTSIRKELNDNLSNPVISNEKKIEYLHFIKNFYTDIEGKIEIDDFGNYSSKIISYEGVDPKEFNEIDISILQNFLIDFKKDLRNEIKNLAIIENKLFDIKMQTSSLKWKASDTDLLELLVALLETNSISIEGKKLTRKEAIKIFEKIFSIEIKDAESKLTRATERKMNTSPYLTSLKEAFENYCTKKENKIT